MRSTTVLSFILASIAVLSPVYAAPVSTEAGSAVTKRCVGLGCKGPVVTEAKRCVGLGCKDAVVPSTTSETTSDSTAQLVQALLDTLQSFQSGISTSTSTTTLDAVVPNTVTDPAVAFGAL